MANGEQAENKKAQFMVKAGLTILSGNAATSLLLLLRNLGVAALISVEDYGIAATFAIAMAVVEMASSLGLQQQIVQSKKGEDSAFQAALQGFQVLRGVLAGVALFALARPLATFMGIPDVAWAYQVLAFVPVLNALQHFDMHRLNRAMVFGPLVLTGAVPALVSLLLVWPLAAWLGDYRVLLWAIMAQALLMLVISHVVAQRPYRLAFDRAVIYESLVFGWPLLVNGILLFVVFQGDKIIVGRVLGMETLALLALGFTLTLTPTLVLVKSTQNFFLPQLSRDGGFDRLAQVTVQVTLVIGMFIVLGVAALGAPLVTHVFGDKYAELVPLLVPLAVMQALRIAKAGPGIISLSQGQASNAMWGNVPRVLSLVWIWFAVVQGQGLMVVIWIACLGEVFGLFTALWLMRRNAGLVSRIWPLVGWSLFLVVLSVTSGWIFWGAAVLIFIGTLTVMRDLRLYVRGQRKPWWG